MEGIVNQEDLRCIGDHHHAVQEKMDQEISQRLGLLALDRMQRIHGKTEAVAGKFLQQEDDRRNDNGDDRNRCRKIIVCPDFTDILLIDDHGKSHISLADHAGRTEVRKGTHENHQTRCQNGGHAQRDNHLEEPPDSLASHVGGRFQKRIVHILQRPIDI